MSPATKAEAPSSSAPPDWVLILGAVLVGAVFVPVTALTEAIGHSIVANAVYYAFGVMIIATLLEGGRVIQRYRQDTATQHAEQKENTAKSG
jgi:Na+/H+ antiporter NhaD/arsenite permease-like protein